MTIRERLRQLYPDHFTQILNNLYRQNKNHYAKWLSDELKPWHEPGLLQQTFIWSASPEGRAYWSLLASNVEPR